MTFSARSCVAALVVVLGASGCSKLYDAFEEEFEDRVRAELPDIDVVEEPPIDPEPELVTINSIIPARGLTTGGLAVEIIGFGFEPGAKVFFGPDPEHAVEASQVQIISETRIQCVTPPYSAPAWVHVAVVQGIDGAFLENAFEYFEEVRVYQVLPARGSTLGGDEVTIFGQGLVEGTQVRFGVSEPIEALHLSDTTLTVASPALPRGLYAVTVINHNGADTLPSAWETFDQVRVTGIDPVAGPVSGGTSVTVRGTGFVPGTVLQLDTQIVSGATPSSSETFIEASTPPHTEGAVDVVTSNENGRDELQGGFVYYDPSVPGPRVIAVTPAASLPEGGGRVRIVGVDLDNGPVTVSFGTNVADCHVVSDYVVSCIAPPGSPGTVDVTLTGGVNAVAPDAFTYVPLRIDFVVPDTGSIAGGTYVTLYGDGYASDAQVWFGPNRARNVSVASPTRLTLRTPAGAEGTVPITIETQGVEITLPDAYTYVMPFSEIGNLWSGGGPIVGEVNVMAIDAQTGGPVEGAFVMLGVNGATPYQGRTNALGMITLSGPDVMGPQTVSGALEGYSAFSWVQVNARNLKLYMQPPGDPGTPGAGDGPGPATISGVIRRIKDEYNYANDRVIVTTTYINFSVPLPPAGDQARIINKGPYRLYARTGEMVVVAWAGFFDSQNRFKPHAMGFYPFLFAEPDGVYENIDITIDTPLNQDLRIVLDDPPLSDRDEPTFTGDAPNFANAFVYYDFGGMGVLEMGNVTQRFADTLTVKMPRRLPTALVGTPFNIEAGVFYSDPVLGTTQPSLGPPQSEVVQYGLTDTTQTVVLTPMVGVQGELAPRAVGAQAPTIFGGAPMHFAFAVNKTSVLPHVNMHFYYDGNSFIPQLTWVAVAAPQNRDFELPWFPPVAGNVNLYGTQFWQLMAMYREGIEFNRLDFFGAFDWKARGVHVTLFQVLD